ncbi:MAG: hypothetical protein ACOC3T_02245, partial [Bacteroidota bacterium]
DQYYSAKAIIPGETDKVKVSFGSAITPADVRFINRDGFEFEFNGTEELQVVGGPATDAQEVLAVVDTGTEMKVLGAMLLASYETYQKTVKIIPIGDDVNLTDADITSLQNKLNDTYEGLGITYSVELDTSMQNDWCGKQGCGTFTPSGSGVLDNNYKDDEALAIENYKSRQSYDPSDRETAYMFAVGGAVQHGDGAEGPTQGKMYFGKQFGFLYALNQGQDINTAGRTLGHELAHGNYKLHHIFTNIFLGENAKEHPNLMSYSTNAADINLNKIQWDIIHDPGVIWGFAVGDEDQELTWKFIDKKHTLLFNHVYDHNKIGNLEYANKIQQNSDKNSISLDYSDDESDSWTHEQQEWIDQWDIGIYDGDKISESIIEKIQNAGDGEKIETINLSENRIYIGKYTVDETEYPVAMYSKKKTLDNLTKVQVKEMENLETAENKKHFYCDEGIIKYFIIAFYEDEEETPALIMQVEKFNVSNWENTKKKWLEFLGVLKEEKELLFEIYCSDTIIEQNDYLTISDTPDMPNLEVKNMSDKEIQFRLKIEYRRDIREDETYFPDGEWEPVKENKIWDIDFLGKIRGGKATLQYKINGRSEEYIFYIRGENPTEQEIKQYITDKGYDDLWFLTRLIRQESSFLHFNSGTDYGPEWEDYQGCPNHGPPHGWGLMQLDLLGGTRVNPLRPTAQELWDWKANIDRGVEFLLNEKHAGVENHFEDDINAVTEWNHYNPEDRIEGAGSQIEGDITYTHSNSNNFDIDFGEDPPQNNKSFIDATWIKHYNGSSGGTDGYPGYYYILKQVGDNKPYWDIQRINSNGHNYVGVISNQNP